jgi:hypothetical protein
MMRIITLATVVAMLFATGCGGATLGAPMGEPAPDPSALAASIQAATVPGTPQRVTFSWNLVEQGSPVGGRGVVRTESPDRIRLDLFGVRGDTYLIAALVGDEYRLPREAANAVSLPSPSLLWAALGVLDPPRAATLTSATTSDGSAELRFGTPNGEIFAYSFVQRGGDRYLLERLERAGNRGVIETVAIERDSDGAISRTRYRDWSAFRDLELVVEEVVPSAAFPPDIWRPDAVAR